MPLVLLAAMPAAAAPGTVSLLVEVGLSGLITPGTWTPMRVEIASSAAFDGTLVVDVPEASRRGTLTSFHRPLRLGGGTRQRLLLDILIRDPRRPLIVRALADGQQVVRQEVRLGTARAVEGVVAALTRDAAGLEFLATFSRRLGPAYIREDDLPVRWQSYEGVDTLIIRDLEDRRLLPAQRQALVEWVAQGGQLLVIGGERLMQQQVPWLLELLPATPTGLAEIPTPRLLRGVRGPVTITTVSPRAGATVRAEGAWPLVVQWRRGRGTVILWTFDAFSPSVRAWSGRLAIWQDILSAPRAAPVATKDLASLLPTTRPLPGRAQAALALLSVLYILALRAALRSFSRRPAGWVGIAAVVFAFGVMLYGFALSARIGATSIAQVSILDVTPDLAVARVTTYASVITPYGGAFRLRAPADSAVRPLVPFPVTFFDGPTEVGGEALSDGAIFEVTQVVPLKLAGTASADADGMVVEIENRTGLVIHDAALYRGGHVYALPDITQHLALRLNPTRWEPIDRRPTLPSDFDRQVRQSIFARLEAASADAIIGRDRPWLVGRVRDDRLRVQFKDGRGGTALHLLVMPFDVLRAP